MIGEDPFIYSSFYGIGDQDRLRLLMNVTDATLCFLKICWEIFINGLRANTDNISYLLPGCPILQHSLTLLQNLRGHYPAATTYAPPIPRQSRVVRVISTLST